MLELTNMLALYCNALTFVVQKLKINYRINSSSYVSVVFITATVLEGPVSVTALIGANAQFHCTGTGNYLVWEVDGLPADHSSISARGITSDTTTSSGTVQSNLTVPATSVNNGTTVRCAVTSLFSTPVISNYSTLTILPGELIC